MGVVLGGCGVEEKGRLDHKEDSHNYEHEIENLKEATGFLEEDTGEEGDDDRLDGGDHGNVRDGKISNGIEVSNETDPGGKASQEKEETSTWKKNENIWKENKLWKSFTLRKRVMA